MNINITQIHTSTLTLTKLKNHNHLKQQIQLRNQSHFTDLNISNNVFLSNGIIQIPKNFTRLTINSSALSSLSVLIQPINNNNIKQYFNKQSSNPQKIITKILKNVPSSMKNMNQHFLYNLIQLQLKNNNIQSISFFNHQMSSQIVCKKFITTSIFSNTSKLSASIKSNQLQDINTNKFQIKQYPNLRKLNLDKNKIQRVSSKVKKQFPNLILLSIMQNDLKQISYQLIQQNYLYSFLSQKITANLKKTSNSMTSSKNKSIKLNIRHQILNEIDFQQYGTIINEIVSKQLIDNQINCENLEIQNQIQDIQQIEIPQQRSQQQLTISLLKSQKNSLYQQQQMIKIHQLLQEYVKMIIQKNIKKSKNIKNSRISSITCRSRDSIKSISNQNSSSKCFKIDNNFKNQLKNKTSICNQQILKLLQSVINYENLFGLEIILTQILQTKLNTENKQFSQKKTKLKVQLGYELIQYIINIEKYNVFQFLITFLSIQNGFINERIKTLNKKMFCFSNTTLCNHQLIVSITAQKLLEAISYCFNLAKQYKADNDNTQKETMNKVKDFLLFLKQNNISTLRSDQHIKFLIQNYSFGPGLSLLFQNEIQQYFSQRKFGHPLQDSITYQILAFDSWQLINKFLKINNFYKIIIQFQTFKKVVKPNWLIYKFLIKQHKKYIQRVKQSRKSMHFRQYLKFGNNKTKRKSILIRNDIYDYNCQILKQYEKMQGSFLLHDKSNQRINIKVKHKDRSYSISQQIDSRIKRNKTQINEKILKDSLANKQNWENIYTQILKEHQNNFIYKDERILR